MLCIYMHVWMWWLCAYWSPCILYIVPNGTNRNGRARMCALYRICIHSIVGRSHALVQCSYGCGIGEWWMSEQCRRTNQTRKYMSMPIHNNSPVLWVISNSMLIEHDDHDHRKSAGYLVSGCFLPAPKSAGKYIHQPKSSCWILYALQMADHSLTCMHSYWLFY